MLIFHGEVVHKNLNTTFTNIEQFIAGLKKQRFTGYCTISFWEYDGVLFFQNGTIIDGIEEIGARGAKVNTGETAVINIRNTAHQKGGEINVYKLPEEKVILLVASLESAIKYEALSTDLTSLDKLFALLRKESLTGYIEIIFENEAGLANIFFTQGDPIESSFASLDNRMIGEPMNIEGINALCQQHGAVFNVHQAIGISDVSEQISILKAAVPPNVIKLFEEILVRFETTVDALVKNGHFQTVFKMILPQVANTYEFLDPFLGEFRYTNKTLSYKGDVVCEEFVNGVCEAINATIATLLKTLQKDALLPKMFVALEPVANEHAALIEQLTLETRLPDILQDYSFLKNRELDTEGQKKKTEAYTVLNLQGIGATDIGSTSILREFYRVIAIIAEKYCDPENNTIQYTNFKRSRDLQQYQTATALLQKFDVLHLKNRDEQLAFWLNLYNFLVIDGILKSTVTGSVQDVKGFFAKTSYRLGEYLFSLDDIEHGILRNNQRRPYAFFKQFSGSDPRKPFCISPPDNRVHCCFMCGAMSSPPLMVYAPKDIDKQVRLAVNRFLGKNGMRVDLEKNELWLNRTFYWYRKDFEQNESTLIDFVVDNLGTGDVKQFIQQNRAKLTIRFMDYDWSLNGK